MIEINEQRFCEQCNRETNHIVREGPLEIEYICKKCNHHQEIVKTFF